MHDFMQNTIKQTMLKYMKSYSQRVGKRCISSQMPRVLPCPQHRRKYIMLVMCWPPKPAHHRMQTIVIPLQVSGM